MELEFNPLQAPCNNVYTALKLVCYCVNQNNNTTITHQSILNNKQHRKSHAWAHSSAGATPQVHFDTTYWFVSSSIRTNIIDVYTRVLLPGTRRNSKRQAGYLVTYGTRTLHYSI